MPELYICKCGNELQLYGLHEFAEAINWTTPRLSKQLQRQMKGVKSRNPIPLPIQYLHSGPIWTHEQVQEFKQRNQLT